MSQFTEEYSKLLIKQYFNKPRAKAEIELISGEFEKSFSLYNRFTEEFDIDQATGDRLDKIGKIVGIPRTVPLVLPKIAFGFSENPNARGFADRFNLTVVGAPFQDKFAPPFTDLQLNDFDYRQIIRAKIAVNNTSAYMVSDERISIQDVIQSAFNDLAYVIDNQDMSLTLYISPSVELSRLNLILRLNLLPKPQAVRYSIIVQAEPGATFGFSDNPNSLGFGDKFDSNVQGGIFANKVIGF